MVAKKDFSNLIKWVNVKVKVLSNKNILITKDPRTTTGCSRCGSGSEKFKKSTSGPELNK